MRLPHPGRPWNGPRRVAVLGSTGSIGKKALAVAARYPDRFTVTSLSAHRSVDALLEQAHAVRPQRLVIGDPALLDQVRGGAPSGTAVSAGPQAIVSLVSEETPEVVVNGIVGRAGLEASLAAAAAGCLLALANKESLVLAGELLMREADRGGAVVLPVDSEHAGLFQTLQGRRPDEVRRLVVTASGGPFRGKTLDDLARVTPAEALNHPIWPMGPRITVDSATLFNKGLEVIETHHLFDIPLDRIGVWVHPQSVVHAVAELTDGSLVAQLSAPDMMLPVQYAMTHPERWDCDAPGSHLPDWGSLTFEEPDRSVFGALDLAYEAGRRGGTAPAVLNAADEVAVAAFLEERLPFLGILDVLQHTLDAVAVERADSLEVIDRADRAAREAARARVDVVGS